MDISEELVEKLFNDCKTQGDFTAVFKQLTK